MLLELLEEALGQTRLFSKERPLTGLSVIIRVDEEGTIDDCLLQHSTGAASSNMEAKLTHRQEVSLLPHLVSGLSTNGHT